jgi:hypothetical protein
MKAWLYSIRQYIYRLWAYRLSLAGFERVHRVQDRFIAAEHVSRFHHPKVTIDTDA